MKLTAENKHQTTINSFEKLTLKGDGRAKLQND